MKILLVLILNAAFLLAISEASIHWINNNWASSCRFRGNHLSKVQSRSEECALICANTTGCTHYTWRRNNRLGTCWLKTGRVTKLDAIETRDKTTICGIPKLNGDVQFEFENRCPYTVWPGIQGRSRGNPNWELPMEGGWELPSGQSTAIQVPSDFNAGRVWGRTGCSPASDGRFLCETGNCDFLKCAQGGVQRGGVPPATLAEFTLNGWGDQDYYDVSLVDGYNLQMTIEVVNPNNDRPGPYWCKNPGCTSDLNAVCPDELKKTNGQGQVIACLSACEKFQTDQYCCRGEWNDPNKCKSSAWPYDYPKFFKQSCPTAYSYAYDDATSTYFCVNTGYKIIFC